MKIQIAKFLCAITLCLGRRQRHILVLALVIPMLLNGLKVNEIRSFLKKA